MSARGWRCAAPALGVLLMAALMLAPPVRAQEQQTGQDKGQQEQQEQQGQDAGHQEQQPGAEQGEEAPATGQQPAAVRKAPPPSGSLAAAAARIHLRRPPDEGQGPVVISNQNLDQVAAEGTVSEGGGVGASAAATPTADGADEGDAANPASDLVNEYLVQKRTVDGLEARLKNFDEQLAKPPVDPYNAQSHNSPQYRAPGVVDNAQQQRDEVAKELAREQAKLDALRARAAREGVELAGPTKPAPTPAR